MQSSQTNTVVMISSRACHPRLSDVSRRARFSGLAILCELLATPPARSRYTVTVRVRVVVKSPQTMLKVVTPLWTSDMYISNNSLLLESYSAKPGSQ